MSIWVLIAFFIGLIVGVLITRFYWWGGIREREAQIQSLRSSLNRTEQRLQEQETNVEHLRDQLKQSERTIQDLTGQVQDRSRTISQHEETLKERDAQLEDMKWRMEEAQEFARGLLDSFQDQGTVQVPARPETNGPSFSGAPTQPVQVQPDDLKRIAGIGPKISGLLQAAGISTFDQLAACEVGDLRRLLKQASLVNLADPGTWPEQAGLAAADDWGALERLQDELRRGRRVSV